MEEIEVIISNDSLLAEDFYSSGNVILKIKKEELGTILNAVLRNDGQILIRSAE